jgi:lipopolysaccharide transport system permease protein
MIDETLVIEAGAIERQYWRDLWSYRELFYVLAKRDLTVRYRQTVIGVAWALLRPFLTMVIFTFIFGSVAKLPTEGTAPYALMVYAGLLPWQFVSTGLSESANSLLNNSALISKVYFPRLIVPISSVVVTFVDFLVSLAILVGMMVWFQYLPSWHIVLLPLLMLMAFMACIGPSLWIAGLNVKYRDFRYIIPFMIQFGLYLSPVGFSSQIIPEKYQFLYSLNPMVGIIDGFRWSILGGHASSYFYLSFFMSIVVITFFLWLGLRQFRRTEKSLADIM